jgi:hypothetical protein
MNNNIIKNTLITLLTTLLVFSNAMSQGVDSSFTYQGELLDNGSPANGQYDINLDLIDGDFMPWGMTSEHSPVEVSGGFFSVNADFGIDNYDGYKDVTVTVSVRKTSEGPGGAFMVLGSQTIQAVPLATNLTNGNATTGEVLTFNGFQWAPAEPVNNSPWIVGSSIISYEGNVGIGSTAPTADLYIDAISDGHALRVRIDNTTKFLVDDNGGVSVGSVSVPPDDGLRVDGDIKQPVESNGAMKFMVHASCGGSSPQSIIKSYNGISNTAITLVSGATIPFSCRVKFPEIITSRYFQVTSIGSAGTTAQGATCRVLSGAPGDIGDTLECLTFRTDTGAYQNGSIMVLIY